MSNMIDPCKYGVSFSLKQCRNFNLDAKETLSWLLGKGWRRFRLMTYWNEHEKEQGKYDFTELDRQLDLIEKYGGSVTLCIGVKQPRWPEYHWPKWTSDFSPEQKTQALLRYLTTTLEHVKNREVVKSYQLENEALLSNFGTNIHIDRKRLRKEFELVNTFDDKPIYMSTSNGWGVPIRRPRPAAVGFSVYTTMFQNGKYSTTIQKPWLHRVRHIIIRHVLRRPVFIHELQCEPWGHTAIWKMTSEEQDHSMSVKQIQRNIHWAHKINVYPIDFWGAEWWYWRWLQGDTTIYNAVKNSLS